MKALLSAAIASFLLAACAAYPKKNPVALHSVPADRKIASLDNNGDVIDDSFDSSLESYYGGSKENELRANNIVADVIKKAVSADQGIRKEMAQSDEMNSPEAQRIFQDLPKPDYATRDVHRKTNGCFKADLSIVPSLAEDANTQIAAYEREVGPGLLDKISDVNDLGVFTPGATYDAIVRLSNGNPGNHPDKVPDARGFAVKILPKDTLGAAPISDMAASDLNLATKLDILTINFPTFFVNDPDKYSALNRGALRGARDFNNSLLGQAEEFTAVFLASKFTALERKLTFLVNGSVIYSPLYQKYFSMVPSRLGKEGERRAVKYSWEPMSCAPELDSEFQSEAQKQWADWTKVHSYGFPPSEPKEIQNPQEPYSAADFPPDFLRAHVKDRLSRGEFCFGLYFQFYRDPLSTNIEDSMDIWLNNEAERDWWVREAVPGAAEWLTSLFNPETRNEYLKRFAAKKIAPRVFAAKLVIHRLAGSDAGTPVGNTKTCEDLSFNPWNGNIAFHKPLGIISRLKRKVYNASRRERHELNRIDDSQIERK